MAVSVDVQAPHLFFNGGFLLVPASRYTECRTSPQGRLPPSGNAEIERQQSVYCHRSP
jgi:hypothetical protein